MSFTLSDITRLNPKMENINDVQLAWYPDDKRNAQLCEFYIWSSHSIGAAKPSVELLEKVREAFLMASSPRRFLFRATYGHGKTHLALALANFFGRSHPSVEVQSILEQLNQSAPKKADGFASFKSERAPHLVLRLFGENISNLPQAVVAALETALRENPASADYQLDFWFDKALGVFANFSAEQIEKSNEFLASRQTDFATLGHNIRARNGELFEMATQLIEHVLGIAPNFGRSVELNQLLPQIARDLCGEGKPFSGVLILFDEFSSFMRSYAQDYVLKRGTPLQSLLDGVDGCGHLAAIVVLSQYDPDSDVKTIFNRIGASDDDRQNIAKEINRLPASERFQLYSSLEIVLSNFLLQDGQNWDELTQDAAVWEQVEDATNDVMRLYGEHYSEQMGWGDERLQTVLTQGCFPFHPLTIAILCKSNLRGDESGARTVMGYLTETFREKATLPALGNGVLGWISPISLVEKFGHAIVEDEGLWGQYNQALRSAGGEAPAAQKAVLHAMLLHDVVGLKVSRVKGSYEKNIAVLSGLSETASENALLELFAAGYLKRDETRQVYAFWPLGEDGSKVEKPLQQEIAAALKNPQSLREILEKAVGKWKLSGEEVAGAPGHPQDWAAEMKLLPRDLLDAAHLRALAQTFRMGKLDINDPARGFVVSLVATTNEDVAYYKTNAQRVLDEALAGMDAPPPFVLRVPQFAQGNFVKSLVREQILLGWDAEQKSAVGLKPWEEAKEATVREIRENLAGYLTDSYIVPLPYRAVVESKTIHGQLMALPNLLKTCYDAAYRNAPPFFTQDKLATATLKKATRTACEFFLKGTFAGWSSDSGVQNNGKTKLLFDNFLAESGARSWGVVDVTQRICEPKSSKVRAAWDELDKAVPPGAHNADIAPAIVTLLNAPWGYDFNTVSLLLCAWIGFHQSQLETQTSSGRAMGAREILKDASDFKRFLEEVTCLKQLRFTRRDAAETKEHVEATIEKIRLKEPFARDEAENAIAQLEIFAEDEKNETRLIQSCRSALAQLQNDLKLAQDYVATLEILQSKIAGTTLIFHALSAFEEAQKEIPLGCVRPETVISSTRLASDARLKLTQLTESYCLKMQALNDIRDAARNQSNLETAKKWFVERGLTDLRDHVQDALYALGAREAELESEGKDAEFVASLKSLKRETGLVALREGLENLANYQSHSPKTEAAIFDAQSALQTTLNSHLAWFAPLEAHLDAATSSGEFNKIDREIMRYADRFAGSPEGAQLEMLAERIESLGKVWSKLADLKRERPKNNADLKKLGGAFEKLTQDAALSDSQREQIAQSKAEIDARFVAQVEAAAAELDAYEARNARGDDAVELKNSLEDALKREMAYLADEHKTRLRALDRALQKRIDDDEIKRVEANFLKIKDASKRRECLRLLQKHAGVEVGVAASNGGELVA